MTGIEPRAVRLDAIDEALGEVDSAADMLADFYAWLQMRRGHPAPNDDVALSVVDEYVTAMWSEF